MDHFFHYSTLNRFRSVVDGSSYGKTGLIPLKRFVRLGLAEKFNLPGEAEEGAVFGLLEPQPISWMQHEYHEGEGLLETILTDMLFRGDEMLLLKCSVLPSDKVYVADHFFHMRKDYNGTNDFENPATAEVKRDYWHSMVPFSDYNGGHVMPEVISFSPIPLDRITVVKKYETTRMLINELREKAGKKPLPEIPKRDLTLYAKNLEELFRHRP